MSGDTISTILIIWLIFLTGVALASLFITAQARKDLKQRAGLLRQIADLRIMKMLDRRGIDLPDYVMEQDVNEIEKQVTNCGGCETTPQCDEVLDNEAKPGESFGFCPNREDMTKMKQEEQS